MKKKSLKKKKKVVVLKRKPHVKKRPKRASKKRVIKTRIARKNPDASEILYELESLVLKIVEVQNNRATFIGLLKYLPSTTYDFTIPQFSVLDLNTKGDIKFYPEEVKEIVPGNITKKKIVLR